MDKNKVNKVRIIKSLKLEENNEILQNFIII